MVVYLMNPALYILKGCSIDDGICEYDSCGTLVVRLSDVLETLLPSSVPDLKLVSSVAHDDGLDFEIDADGCNVGLFEMALAKASNQVGFAHSTVSNDYNLGHKVIFICFFLSHVPNQIIMT